MSSTFLPRRIKLRTDRARLSQVVERVVTASPVEDEVRKHLHETVHLPERNAVDEDILDGLLRLDLLEVVLEEKSLRRYT